MIKAVSGCSKSEEIISFSPWFRLCAFVSYWFLAPFIILVNNLVYGLKIEGRENLRLIPAKGCILISNHSLYMDPALVGQTIFPRKTFYAAQLGHFRNAAFGMFIRLMGAFPLPADLRMRNVETAVRKALERSWYVHFFPEGVMKHLSRDIGPFRKGAFYLAERLDVPVVPVTLIHRRPRVFGREMERFFVRVTGVIGEPIFPDRSGQPEHRTIPEAMSRKARAAMRAIVAENDE